MKKESGLTEKEITNSVNMLSVLLANTYLLYLKTQNYHWNVEDRYFSVLHELFENQYKLLADAIDEIAERIRILGVKAPAKFSEFLKLTNLTENTDYASSHDMLHNLLNDHETIIIDIRSALIILNDSSNDEGTKDFLINRLQVHEKLSWILRSHLNKSGSGHS